MEEFDLMGSLFCPVIIGFILDCLIGDPHWFPHPVRLFGSLINTGDKYLNKDRFRFAKGAVLTILLVLLVYFVIYGIQILIENEIALVLFNSFLFYLGIANRSLIEESWKVESLVRKKDIDKARYQVSMIVGRETNRLNLQQIRKACLETMSENLSDGVIAPIMFYAIGGLPLMFAYKMVNTLDSMIGYKNDRYFYFGKFAAKLDDILNYIPARLTALLMALISFSPKSVSFIIKYGRCHSSPNSAYPEAALAGILNCRFGGPNYYHGKLVEKQYIGREERDLLKSDFTKTSMINFAVCLIMIISVYFVEMYF
ncbi:MAG: adenosylcobinamide-phosphate synthase CbiB [Marinifilaceae bacterium]|nr:adenosylcobinamide-phosphate synthase CbiB [Marinifilaceae bacterium]